jgi:serine/threonine protein kinase
MNFCLHIDKYLTEEENLTSGGFSIVNKGTLIKIPVAIKKISKTNSTNQELNLLQLVKSKYLPIFFGIKEENIDSNFKNYSTSEVWLSIILEKINGNTLDHYLKSNPSRLLKSINICEFASIVYQLHCFNMIHKDLKPKNIMIDENFTLKLLDFGVSVRTEENQSTCSDAGTLCYMSPEYIPEFDKHGNLIPKINEKSDVWAFGLILSEIFSGERPWKKLINQSYDVINLLKRKIPFQIPSSITDTFERDFISNCTIYDCNKRFSSKDCLIYSLMILYTQVKEIYTSVNSENRILMLYELLKEKLIDKIYHENTSKSCSIENETFLNKSLNYSDKSYQIKNNKKIDENFNYLKKVKSTPFAEVYNDKHKNNFNKNNKERFKFDNNCKTNLYENLYNFNQTNTVNKIDTIFKICNDKKKANKKNNKNSYLINKNTDLESIANEYISKKLNDKINNKNFKVYSEITDTKTKNKDKNFDNLKNKIYFNCLKKVENNLKSLIYFLVLNKKANSLKILSNVHINQQLTSTNQILLKNEEEKSLYYSAKKDLSLCETTTINTINAPTLNLISKIDTEIETSDSLINFKNVEILNNNDFIIDHQSESLSIHVKYNENKKLEKIFEYKLINSSFFLNNFIKIHCSCNNCLLGNESVAIILNKPQPVQKSIFSNSINSEHTYINSERKVVLNWNEIVKINSIIINLTCLKTNMYDLLCPSNKKSKEINKTKEDKKDDTHKFYNGQELFIYQLKSNKFLIMNNDFDIINEYSPFNTTCSCNSNIVQDIINFDVLANNRIIFTFSNNIVVYDVLEKTEVHHTLKNYKSIRKILVCTKLSNFPEINNNYTSLNNKNKQKVNQPSIYYLISPVDSIILACINNRNKPEFIVYSISNKSKVQICSEFAENWDENVFSIKNKYLLFTEKKNIVNIVDLTKPKSESPFETIINNTIIDVHLEVLQSKSFKDADNYKMYYNYTILLFLFSKNNIVKTFEIRSNKEKLISNTTLTKVEKLLDPMNTNSDELPKNLYFGYFLFNNDKEIIRLNFFSNTKKFVVSYCNLLTNIVNKVNTNDFFNVPCSFKIACKEENLSSVSSYKSLDYTDNLQNLNPSNSNMKKNQFLVFIENTQKILLINSSKRNFSISIFK